MHPGQLHHGCAGRVRPHNLGLKADFIQVLISMPWEGEEQYRAGSSWDRQAAAGWDICFQVSLGRGRSGT